MKVNTQFKNRRELEVLFKRKIDPMRFPRDILWNCILTGDPCTEVNAFRNWLHSCSKVTELSEVKSKKRYGNYSIVSIDKRKGTAKKMFKIGDETLIPLDKPEPLYYCLAELANYFLFKAILGSRDLVKIKSISFRRSESHYQISFNSELLHFWDGSDENRTISTFFNNTEKLWKMGITLVHGDFKVNNIMETLDGDVKIIDFGISLYHITFSDPEEKPIFNTGYSETAFAPNSTHVDLKLFVDSWKKLKPFGTANDYYDSIYEMKFPEIPFNWRDYREEFCGEGFTIEPLLL